MGSRTSAQPGTGDGASTTEPTHARYRFALWLVLIAALALAVRFLYLAQFSPTPFARCLVLDAEYYDGWASRIAAGDILGGDRPFFFEPGYAYLLAAVKSLGGGWGTVRVIHILLGTGAAVCTALIARRLAGDRAGIAAGILAALYLPGIYFEGFMLKTTTEVFLGTMLLALVLHATGKSKPLLWGGVGLLMGLAGFVKGNFLVLPPICGAWVWWTLRRRGSPRPWLSPLAMLAGCACMLAVTTWRNHAVSGELIPLVYESGYNFYIGNGPEADGVSLAPSFVRPAPLYEELDSNAEAVRRAGRELSYRAISAFWWRESGKGIRAAPLRWIEVLWNKFLIFWNRFEFSDNISITFVRDWVPLLRAPLPGWWLAAPLGMAGLVVAFRKREEGWMLVAGYILVLMLALVLFKVVDRYRVSLAPAMIALGCAALAEAWRDRHTTGLIVALAGGVALVLTNIVPSRVGIIPDNLATHHEIMGVALSSEGRADEAIAQFRKAVAMTPNRSAPHYNLARALHRLKHDPVAAEAAVREALRLAPDDGESFALLGAILLERGQPREAAAAYQRAAACGFKPAASLVTAAGTLGQIGVYDEAAQVLDEALRLEPNDPMGLEVLGNLRYMRDDFRGAIEAWERSLQSNPTNHDLRANVEQLRAQLGGP
jgi:tetratricopeptide (TPR) repeat protein